MLRAQCAHAPLHPRLRPPPPPRPRAQWGVATILVGLLSFMAEEEPAAGTVYEASQKTPAVRRRLAAASRAWNRDNADFVRLFPEEAKAPSAAAASSSSSSSSAAAAAAAAAGAAVAAAGAGAGAGAPTAAEAEAAAFFAEVLGDSPPAAAGGKRARLDPSPGRSVRSRGGGGAGR